MIPNWLAKKLASPPDAGAGVHAWLFSVARQLHAHMPADAVEAALQAATANCGRYVPPREIRDAVRNSHAVQWQRREVRGGGNVSLEAALPGQRLVTAAAPDSTSLDRWPAVDPVSRRCRVADSSAAGVGGLVDLWERSPVRPERDADDWLDWLFPGSEWLCLAKDHPSTARTRRREAWSFGPAADCGLVVPSPMTGPSGAPQNPKHPGERSHRCLDNTGPRRWLVIEFDKLEDGKTPMPLDEQAALHWHFRAAAIAAGWPRLALVVHSGGKSLHGWYGLCHDEDQTRELMEYAASLGADPATWVRCQLVRLPGGVRNGKRLEVFFFDPSFTTAQAPGRSVAQGVEARSEQSTLPAVGVPKATAA